MPRNIVIPGTAEDFSTMIARGKRAKNGQKIVDKDKLEQAILLYCKFHFNQAAVTPLGLGYLADLRLTSAGEEILNGTFFAR